MHSCMSCVLSADALCNIGFSCFTDKQRCGYKGGQRVWVPNRIAEHHSALPQGELLSRVLCFLCLQPCTPPHTHTHAVTHHHHTHATSLPLLQAPCLQCDASAARRSPPCMHAPQPASMSPPSPTHTHTLLTSSLLKRPPLLPILSFCSLATSM